MRNLGLKKLLKRAIRVPVYAMLSKRLPPATDGDRELAGELRAALRRLSQDGPSDGSQSEKQWLTHEGRLADLALHNDPRHFLRWDVIQYTMFATRAAINLELAHLRGLPGWKPRWHNALAESPVGRPLPFWRYPRSSGNLIHHAYNVAQFEEETETRVEDLDYVFEFGGGYGSMCRLFHNLGFQGKYVLYDLPGFSALQEFYLKSLGKTVQSPDQFSTASSGIVCVSDLESLKAVLPSDSEIGKSMFIATWSLSESPLSLRDTILSLVSDFQTYLIASQSTYAGTDNIEFFRNWRESRTDVEWHSWQIEHLGRNFYVVGQRKQMAPSPVSD